MSRDAELDALRAEIAALREETRTLRGEVADLRRRLDRSDTATGVAGVVRRSRRIIDKLP